MPLLTRKLATLQQTKIQLATLEAEIRAELPQELAVLPARYGYDSAAAFIRAVKEASAGRSRHRNHRKERRELSEQERARLTADLKDGMPYKEAEAKYDVSAGTIYNAKKAAGLV